MSTAQGRIVSIEGNSVKLRIAEQSACGSCHSKSACGVGSTREIHVDDFTRGRLRQGDKVELVMPGSLTLGLAAALYVPPAVGFLLGMVGVAGLGAGDGFALLGGFAGLATGMIASRLLARLVNANAMPEVRLLPD